MSPSVANRVLPLGIDAVTFDAILDAFEGIVGPDNVSRDSSSGAVAGPHGQTNYDEIYQLVEGDIHAASGAVRPASVEEIQAVLKIANQHKLPMWTISRGKNLGYGGSSPVLKGSFILDLHRMKKIIEVHEEYAYAIVEPGVTFFDLFEYIQEKGYKLWISCPAIGWGSIIGNTTERGFGYVPTGEHTQQQCGMEVILPNGEIIRTGMGAMEGNVMWPLFKGGYGPSIDGLFYQSNLGIVTKLGIHLTPAPEFFMSCKVSVPREEDLGLLVSKLADLERRQIITNHASISNLFRQCTTTDDVSITARIAPYAFKERSYVPESLLNTIAAEKAWGWWQGEFALYGPQSFVNASWDTIQTAFKDVKGVKFSCTTHSGNGAPIRASEMGYLPEYYYAGYPSVEPLKMVEMRGKGGGHVDMAPLIPVGGVELMEWYKSAKSRVRAAGFDLWADFHVFGRYVNAIALIMFGPNEGPQVKELMETLLEDAAKMRYSEYRAHVDLMDEIAGHYNYRDGALRKFVSNLKEKLDPNGVLSQGKQGIWNARVAEAAGRTAKANLQKHW